MHFQSKFSPAARKLDRQIGLSPEISIVFDWLSALCYVSKSWVNDCDKDPMTHRWAQAFEFAGTKTAIWARQICQKLKLEMEEKFTQEKLYNVLGINTVLSYRIPEP